MKRFVFTVLLLISVSGFHRMAAADGNIKIVELRVSDVVIPDNLDSNADAFVIETGVFPNGCYQWAFAQVTSLDDNVTEVQSYAFVRSGMCPMIMIPFHQKVILGKLSTGTHVIRFANSDGTYFDEQLKIE